MSSQEKIALKIQGIFYNEYGTDHQGQQCWKLYKCSISESSNLCDWTIEDECFLGKEIGRCPTQGQCEKSTEQSLHCVGRMNV